MGKQRFRLSHMIPNAWFYRLRDMNTAAASGTTVAAHNKKPLSTSNQHQNNPRNSFCYTPKLHQVYTSSPNKNTIFNKPPSSKHVLGSIYIQSSDSTLVDQDMFLSPAISYNESPLSEPTRSLDKLLSTYSNCGVNNSSKSNVKVEFHETSYNGKAKDSSGYDLTREIERPPEILTKSKRDASIVVEKKNEESCGQNSNCIKISKETRRKKPVVKIRPISSKTKVCKRQAHGNNDSMKFSSSCCIVKSTFDPQKDLKESMLEMIVENNIRASKDLEKLLACYLSLNSNKYHDMIIKAFEEIWMTFDFVA